MATLPAVLCIDVEPDPREAAVPETQRLTGFEDTFARLPELRAALASTGATTANWGVG